MNNEYPPEELTPDGLPTLDAQLRRLEDVDRETERNRPLQFQHQALAMRVKCLALDMMGLSPMTNTYSLSNKQREQLQNNMRTFETEEPETIIEQFNTVMNDKVFISTLDPSKLPIYHV